MSRHVTRTGHRDGTGQTLKVCVLSRPTPPRSPMKLPAAARQEPTHHPTVLMTAAGPKLILLDGILSKGRRLFCRLPLRLRKRRPLANDLPAQHVVIHVSSHSSLSAEAK